MDHKKFLFLTFFCLLNFGQFVRSDPPTLFPYGGPEIHDLTLPRENDDVSSPEFKLSTPIMFFGQSYKSLFINQNGLVSFITEIPSFVNIPFPLDFPSIAPFYSDIDTRVVGNIYYRETNETEHLDRAGNLITNYFSSAQQESFKPTSLVIVTWESVGYFDKMTDKTNTFQLVISSDGHDSYVTILYERIEWIQGTGKNPNMPDAKAQAGFISGNGFFFAVKGSGSDQMSNLHKAGNTGEEGVWIFRVGRVGDTVSEPDLNVELGESTSEASSSCLAASTVCHSQAQCVDYEPGFCCICSNDSYGNGRVCLQKGIPQRINGRVKGIVNGVSLDDSELFSYILPSDGRAYTAIAKIPERLGYDFQSLSNIGTIVGWLFSTSIKGAPNGFQITGGIFNYTSELTFPKNGQKVTISQSYSGLDVFNNIKVDTRIHGNTPSIPNRQIEINDYEMSFTRVSSGTLRSSSSHKYIIEGTSIEDTFTVEQTIEYKECPWSSPIPPEYESIKMKVGRNYIYFDPSQNIVRFAITSKVTPPDGEDPCKENKDKCGVHSSCVSEDDTFKCVCDLGFEHQFTYEGSEVTESKDCNDIDECRIGTASCDVKAICQNTPGSFGCICLEGFEGDGYSCAKVLTCTDVQCGANGVCSEISPGVPECRCLPGFYGDGLFCYEQTVQDLINTGGNAPDCRQLNICHPYANCIYSLSSNSHVCSCRPGYSGDGLTCTKEPTESCLLENTCHPEAMCLLSENNEYSCVCKHNYIGDGYTCQRTDDQNYDQNSNPEPSCLLAYCWCPKGFIYDTLRRSCEKDEIPDSQDCYEDPTFCHINATCLWQSGNPTVYACVCNAGHMGDGLRCFVQDFCTSHSDCAEFGECVNVDGKYNCRCREGFEGDGKFCLPKKDVGCDILRNCDANAQCVWESSNEKYQCTCNRGFKGNGLECQEDLLGCNILKNCGRNAECGYDSNARGFRCHCKAGYIGDGTKCRSTVPCYQDRSVCDPNAECIANPHNNIYSCRCNIGFIGDGQECREEPKLDGAFLIAANGMSLIKVPLAVPGQEKPFPLVVEPFQTAIGVTTDCLLRKIYWSDVGGRSIKVSTFNGTEKEDFLTEDIGSPEGLAMDVGSGNIYWTDSSKDTIEVANLKTKLRKTIISTDLINPRGLAVYESRGRLFWTDWNREHPKIEYSGLDGQERAVFIKDNLVLPNALVIDTVADEICWADAGTHTIECIEIDGRNRRTIVKNAKYPFGLAMSSDKFYFTDWETKKLESATRFEGTLQKSIEISLGGSGKVYGLALVPITCSLNYSPCEYSPCGQDRLCLPNARGGRSCICPNNANSDCRDII